jgi:uncharacterized protein DUF4352
MRNSLKILGGIALIAAVGGCSSNSAGAAADSSTATGSTAGMTAHSTAAHGTAAAAKIGETVSAGKLSFTVTEAATQGRLLVVDVTVKNTGDQVRAFDAADQVLWSGHTKYKATADAKSLGQQIKPGSEVTSTLSYDVPKDFKVATAVIALRGATLSGGTEKVDLVK